MCREILALIEYYNNCGRVNSSMKSIKMSFDKCGIVKMKRKDVKSNW